MTTSSASASSATRSIVYEGTFVRLWTGTTASGLATWALPFVFALAVVDRLLNPAELGLLLAMRTVGFLVAVPVSGVLADRYSRRATVLAAGLVAAAATGVAAVGLGYNLALTAVATLAAGAGQGACRPAFQALTAEIVDGQRRQQANAAITLAVRLTTLVAPGLTTLLGIFVGTRSLLAGIGLFWIIAALIPPRSQRTGASGNDGPAPALFAEFADGIREARRHPWFLPVLGALTAVIATGYSATGVILPLVSRDRFGTQAVLAGAMTAYIVGALLGALIIARLRPRWQGWSALAGLACYGFAPLSLLLPLPPVVIIAAYVVAGLGIELFNVPWFTATQREIAPSKLARVSSLDFLFSYGLAPLGLALIAPAISVYGAAAVLSGCAAVCFLAPALAMAVPGTRHFSGRSTATRPSGEATP